RNYRRYLVAGVSLGALSALPTGVAAQTVTCDPVAQNGCELTDNDPTVELTMIMSEAGDDFFYGDSVAGDGGVAVVVSSTTDPNGGLFVLAGTAATGDALLSFSNAGTATIGAVVEAGGAAAQNADATIALWAAINVDAQAPNGTATASLDNSGAVNVLASAEAVSTGANGDADATVPLGALLVAHDAEAAVVNVDNAGEFNVGADAIAGGTTAQADAFVLGGIVAAGTSADSVDVNITNSGLIGVDALADADAADATGANARASATALLGVAGAAIDFSSADISLTNSAGGVISVDAVANANAVDTTGTANFADADAL